MSVSAALEDALLKLPASPLEAEICRTLAKALDDKDNGQGKASTSKELRALLAEMAERTGENEVDDLDELTKRRAARLSS